MQFQSPSLTRRFASKALKVVLSLLLVVGFLPAVEQEAEASEGNTKILSVLQAYNGSTYAVAQDGTLYAWGNNDNGQLGKGYEENAAVTSPAKIMEGMSPVMATGLYGDEERLFFSAVAQDGTLYTWGDNSSAQLGDGTFIDRMAPVGIMGNVVSVSSGTDQSFAVTEDGSLYGWGHFYLSDEGKYGYRTTPVEITGGVSSVHANADCLHVITEDGSLYGWGTDSYDIVGLGEDKPFPVPLTKIMDDVSSVHSTCSDGFPMSYCMAIFAIKDDGSLWAWGNNTYGMLGDGSGEHQMSPVKIMEDVSSVYSERGSSFAIAQDGSLYAWGLNGAGQLGDGTTADRSVPVKVMEGVKRIVSDGASTFAIAQDGSLYAWGLNGAGQLGDGTTADRSVPVKVMEGVLDVKARSGSVFAITEDGFLYAWGRDYGCLGLGSFKEKVSTPTRVLFPGDSVEDPDAPTPPVPGEPSDPDAPTSSETIETTALIRAEETEYGCVEYPVTWDNDWFLTQDGGRYEYNPDLAVTACAIAGSAYAGTSLEDKDHNPFTGPPDTQRLDFVHATLGNLGFKDIDVSVYSDRLYNTDSGYADGYDKVAYAFANKRIPDGEGGWDTLVAVVVRGTPGNVEWISNANVDDANGKKASATSGSVGNKTHEGFGKAKDEMWDALHAYMDERGIDPEGAKYLVTGHSRGAAVANLAAASLTRQYGTQGVYAYCYATPRAEVKTGSIDPGSDIFDNIYNIVNPEDFVPRVALAKWGYVRYGKTCYLPSKSTQCSLWERGSKGVNASYLSYFDKKYVSFKGAGSTDGMIESVYSLAPSAYAAYKTERRHLSGKRTFIEYFASLMEGLAYGGWEYADWAADSIGSYAKVSLYFAANYANGKLFGAHSEKTYLLWLDELRNMGVTPIQAGEPCDTGKMTMYCPVDVTVYDPDGNVAARIVDDVLDEGLAESDEGLAAYVDPDTGAKSVWVPLGQGYRVETVATDEGTLDVTWSVSEPEGDVVEQEARVDLPLEEGATYTATVSDQGSEGAFEDSVSFVDGDGEEIEPDFTADAETAGSLEVSVTAAEGGTASGNAQATAGDHVTVSATPEPGYLFDGWYEDGSLVSSEADWTFRAEASRTLEARFVACGHPNGTKPCEDCGYREIELSDCEFALEFDAATYDGTRWEPDATLTCDGVELVEGRDYELSYRDNKRAGTATVTAATEGGEMSGAMGVVLLPGSATAQFEIVKASMSQDARVSIPYASCAYSGAVRKPVPTVKVGGVRQLASEYEVTYWNKAKTKRVAPKLVGTYWVRVMPRGSANVSGTAWKRFAINPKATANLRLTELNNGFKASWSKRTVQVTGYQVQYRLKGKAAWSTKWVTSYKTGSKSVLKLKDRRYYQVRVRTYKTVGGVKYYSAWTGIKTVRTK